MCCILVSSHLLIYVLAFLTEKLNQLIKQISDSFLFRETCQRYKQIELTQTIVNRVSGMDNSLGFEASQNTLICYMFLWT